MIHMAQQPNIVENKMRNIESTSSLSDILKKSFFVWLSNGYAKKYPPEVCFSCIDKVSEYLIRRKISSVSLWEIKNFGLFKSVYNKAINDNLFKATDKKTHTAFVQVGKIFLRFLKSKPVILKAYAAVIEQIDSPLTIKETIIRLLAIELHGMTAKQICNKIIADGLYSFSAQIHQEVVQVEIDRACVNSNYNVSDSEYCFRFKKNQKGEKVYFLLPLTQTDDTTQSSIIAVDKSVELKRTINKPNNIEIWNNSIQRKFKSWMESENYATLTVKNYCGTINRTVQNFKSLVDVATNEFSTMPKSVDKFVSLLNQDSGFIAANSIVHNQLSAALSAFVRFAGIESSIQERIAFSIQTTVGSETDDIIDLEEGKSGIREILHVHFLTLHGYSNIGILWSAVQNSLSMFLNDNAINSVGDFGSFLVMAFKHELVFSLPHIWQNEPDYPHSSRGLIINIARQHGGVVTREQIDGFFSRIKLTSLYNSVVLDKEQLLFCDHEKFMLTEYVNPSAERCSVIAKALNMLISRENAHFIILRDISLLWFSRLPELPNGTRWTPLLLQELLRICPEIGYRIISPDLKGQALDTVGAAIVSSESDIETFAEIVHQFCFEKYKLPVLFSAEKLRIDLRTVGMLTGNELIYNMHKALKDHRFAFSDENRMVMILER